jgi:bifunctional DNA-binding transcriptional regulator/antitoxin component of YhaV-PrlF toxin-antitoxin module
MSLISRKNQVTLPVAVLRAAGLEPGDDVQVNVLGPGRVELALADDVVARHAGIFGNETYSPGYLEELRSEWRDS